MVGDPLSCAINDCATTIGLVSLRIEPKTIDQLALPPSDEPVTARLCTRHYLVAMHEVLTRAKLPRQDPVVAAPSPMRAPL